MGEEYRDDTSQQVVVHVQTCPNGPQIASIQAFSNYQKTSQYFGNPNPEAFRPVGSKPYAREVPDTH